MKLQRTFYSVEKCNICQCCAKFCVYVCTPQLLTLPFLGLLLTVNGTFRQHPNMSTLLWHHWGPLRHHGNSNLHLSFTHIVYTALLTQLEFTHSLCSQMPATAFQSPTIWRGSALSDVRRREQCFRSMHAVIQDIWPKLEHRHALCRVMTTGKKASKKKMQISCSHLKHFPQSRPAFFAVPC